MTRSNEKSSDSNESAQKLVQNYPSRSSRKQRVTFRIPEDQLEGVEDLVEDDTFANRSEAIRAALTSLIEDNRDAKHRAVR